MSEELRRLAERIAQELARRDLRSDRAAVAVGAARGAPPETENTSAERSDRHHSVASSTTVARANGHGPAGVRFVRENARIADYIDHTLLKAEATREEIDTLCREARDNRFAAVCVNPVWVERCAGQLAGSGVAIATVIAFPLGASMPQTKADEASRAIANGATELDMVAAIGHIKSGDWRHVFEDIRAVVDAAKGTLVKVIIESAALTPTEIIKSSAIAKEAGAQYVKTSTGFHSTGGASAEAVALMRLAVGDALGVKASGGVRDCPTALRMIANGATRIGTSSGVAMSQCLGPGPLPVRDLLSLADRHDGHCATGACTAAPDSGRSY